jgi:hypothetical protein
MHLRAAPNGSHQHIQSAQRSRWLPTLLNTLHASTYTLCTRNSSRSSTCSSYRKPGGDQRREGALYLPLPDALLFAV